MHRSTFHSKSNSRLYSNNSNSKRLRLSKLVKLVIFW
jgi:hypothetical protein